MAVQETNTTATNTTHTNNVQQPQSEPNGQWTNNMNTEQTQTQTPPPGYQAPTNAGFRGFGANKISRSAAIESVNAFMEIGQKVIDNNGQSAEYKLVRIPDESTRIPLPVIALYKTFAQNGKLTTIVRPVIYGTEQLGPRKTGGGNGGYGYTNEVEVESAPGDAYTDGLWSSIVSYITTACGVKGDVIDASCFSIPQHFIPDEAKMTVLMANAVTMIESWANLRIKQEFEEVNPEFFNNGKTEARMDFNPKAIHDSVGNPIRADWAVAVTYQENGQQGTNNDFTNTRTPIVNVYGYVDVILTNQGGQQQQPQQAAWGTNFQQPAPYTPMLVITHIESDMGLLTPAMVLLGLHAMTAIIDNGNFTRTFRHKANPKMKRTIAALCLETPYLNVNKVAGIPDISSSDEAFFTLTSMAISRSPIIAIDIEETGDNNTIMQLIRMVGDRDPKAIEVLTRSANILTNGNFAVMASRNNLMPTAICASDNNRIALGSYSVDGQVYDRREVDKLAMLTALGQTDMATVQSFDETMNNTAIPVDVRLAQNWAIVNSCLQSTSPVTGYARRVLLSGKFLATVNDSIRAANIHVFLNGGTFDGQTQRGRDYASVSNMAYQATSGQFTQNNGWGNTAGNGGFATRTGW